MAQGTERENYKLVVVVLTVITMSCIIGDIVLVALNKKPPEALINLAFSTGGALGGILTNPAKEVKSSGNDLETLGGMAAKSIIDEAMRQMGKNSK